MSVIETIRGKLKKYPLLAYEHTARRIIIPPVSPEGFAVSLYQDGPPDALRFVVGLGGWHEHFDSADEALECLAWGLSDQCRLRVTSRGRTEHRWTVQRLIDNTWNDESTTGLLLFPFWLRRSERLYQNHVIHSD